MPSKNQLFLIRPYLHHGVWVFDDPAVGLVKEPFVAGIPEMIERATGEIPDASRGFVAIFSAGFFPGAQIVLERDRDEGGGTWYRWPEMGQEGWLCPALFRYFETAPERLYIQVKPVPASGGA
jgi:hypothetical protein